MPVCGSDGEAFAFIEKSNTRYGVTTDISVGQDAFIQFDFSASCSVTNSCYCEHLTRHHTRHHSHQEVLTPHHNTISHSALFFSTFHD